jgi:type II secretory pathway component PulF
MTMSNVGFQRLKAAEANRAKTDPSIKLKPQKLLTFFESFRNLYEAGMPIDQLLTKIMQATDDPKFKSCLHAMAVDMGNGKFLSESAGQFPGVFPSEVRALIRVAENSGRWTKKKDINSGEIKPGILDMIISYMKSNNTLREKVKTGMYYPAIIFFAIVGALIAFGFYVLPSLRTIFEAIGPDSQKNISSTTRMMFWMGDMIVAYWWAFPVALVGGIIAFIYWWRVGNAQQLWDHYQLHPRVKLIGPVFQKLNTSEICWLMGTLFGSGMTPQEVLSNLQQAVKNSELAGSIELAKEYLYQGIPFCDALKKAHFLFDGQTYLVISTSQASGRLEPALQSYAQQLSEQVAEEMERLIKLIEPIMLLCAGVVVAFILISYYSGISSAIGSLATGGR